jgi:hypothetical protein
LAQEKSREELIELLFKEIERLDSLEKKWTEEERVKGNDPDKDIPIRCCRMQRTPYLGWLIAEKELLALKRRQRKKKTKTSPEDIRKLFSWACV